MKAAGGGSLHSSMSLTADVKLLGFHDESDAARGDVLSICKVAYWTGLGEVLRQQSCLFFPPGFSSPLHQLVAQHDEVYFIFTMG